MEVRPEILAALVEELTRSYMQACRVVPVQSLAIVAGSLQSDLRFASIDEIRGAFRKARQMEDIPTARVLGDALRNFRAESMPKAARIADNRKAVTNEQTTYIMAWNALYGDYPMDKEKAKKIVNEFEANENNRDFVVQQRRIFDANKGVNYGT